MDPGLPGFAVAPTAIAPPVAPPPTVFVVTEASPPT